MTSRCVFEATGLNNHGGSFSFTHEDTFANFMGSLNKCLDIPGATAFNYGDVSIRNEEEYQSFLNTVRGTNPDIVVYH